MGYTWKGAPELAAVTEPVEEPPRTGMPGPKPGPAPWDPAKCGTRNGYKQHRRHNIPACGPCRAANTAYTKSYDATRKNRGTIASPFDASKCGTPAGYGRHQRRRMIACTPCLVAHNAKSQEYKAARKAAA